MGDMKGPYFCAADELFYNKYDPRCNITRECLSGDVPAEYNGHACPAHYTMSMEDESLYPAETRDEIRAELQALRDDFNDLKASFESHNHDSRNDGRYSKLNHHHNSKYAKKDHHHNSLYSKLNHTHNRLVNNEKTAQVALQGDCNFVLYKGNDALWASGTDECKPK